MIRSLSRSSLLCLTAARKHSREFIRIAPTISISIPTSLSSRYFDPIPKALTCLSSIRASSSSSSSSLSSTMEMEQAVSENEGKSVQVLLAKNDEHGGVIVEMIEAMEPQNFLTLLRASISLWRLQGKRGVWIKLPIELANLVEVAVKEGFWYHHAEPRYLMLVYWIPETPNTLPANATHRVGIGALVMNANREVLVVKEKSGFFRGKGVWKFPTGVVDEDEDICDAAVREVKEETGIDAEFVDILAFRQSHKSFFEKSDLFFVCMLRPLSLDIQIQELEIEAAQWMPFEEYAGQPFVVQNEMLKYINKICLAKLKEEYSGFSPIPTSTGFSNKKFRMYLNNRDLNSHGLLVTDT